MIPIAINGFGRIGRMITRALYENNINELKIIAINDLSSPEILAHLLKYDSIHGTFQSEIYYDDHNLFIDGQKIVCYQEKDPTRLWWKDIEIVYECSGLFTTLEKAMQHIKAGARKVLVSAPCKDSELTVVYGVNHQKISPSMRVISNASCTTNCLAPVAQTLHNAFSIKAGFMTTVHAYTSDQRVHDNIHRDLRRARNCHLSMIPTSTGAANAIGDVIPVLDGKLAGSSIRVPVANVSLIDFVFETGKEVTIETINTCLKNAANGKLNGILTYNNKSLVSIDFNHNTHSAIFDENETHVIKHNFARVLAWYDNEWAFSCRMHDVAKYWGNL